MTPGRNVTWVKLVGGERSHHCAIPAPPGFKSISPKFTSTFKAPLTQLCSLLRELS